MPKLPNLRDGLALSYAAANKGKSKAAKRAIEAAYMENYEPFIKSTEDKLSQPERSKVQSTQKINEEKQSLAKLIGDPDENYKHNKTVDLYKTGAMSSNFINNQLKLEDFKFGIKNINHGGCGLIATFNVLQGVGKPQNFADLIYKNENAAIIKGGLGVYPTEISDFLKSNDLEVVTDYIGVDKNYDISNCDAVIHLYFRKDGSAHYVAGISDGNDKFRSYNSDTGKTFPMTWKEYFEDTLETNKESPVIYSSAYRIKK